MIYPINLTLISIASATSNLTFNYYVILFNNYVSVVLVLFDDDVEFELEELFVELVELFKPN